MMSFLEKMSWTKLKKIQAADGLTANLLEK